MILCDFEIRSLCDGGMVEGYLPELINPASLDVRLASNLLIEAATSPELVPLDLSGFDQERPYPLKPGQFVLASTMEVFHLPSTVAAQFMLKSSRAREGLEHLMAGYADPGFNNSTMTLELHNSRQLHPVGLWPGMRIGQMVFHRMSAPPLRDYGQTGRYNSKPNVCASLG